VVEPRQALARTIRAGVAVLVAGGLAYAVWANRRGATALDWNDSWAAFAGAAALFAVAPLAQAGTFVFALRGLGAAAPWLDGMAIWMRSFLFRYAPSGALGYVYRVRRREQLGAETPMLLKATGLEQLGALLAGAVVALGGFLLGGSLAAVAASRPRLVLRLAAIDAAAWLATGLGVWLLVSRLAATDELSFGWLLGAYATAWLAGFLVPFAPGGLGFREGALAAFLAEPLGTSAAVTVALAVRLASTVGELIAVGAVELVWRRRRPR
jgi:glycosyltransferase 2 family protein